MRQAISSHTQIDFDLLRSFERIVVSGPQRSGTNLTSQFLSQKLERRYVDELEFDFYLESHFINTLKANRRVVVQAPTMSHILHLVDIPSTFVFFCVRDVCDIIKSEDNMRWSGHKFERRNYSQDEYSGLPISQAKYNFWFFKQRPLMICPFREIHFSSFVGSDIWIDKRESGKTQPDTSWKPDASNDNGERWSYVRTDKGCQSLEAVDYWFEDEKVIESCRVSKMKQAAKGQKGQKGQAN
jgi:hypothetical protein